MGFEFCSIASGSSGNCQYIESENASVLLDAGVAGKRITEGLEQVKANVEKIMGVLVTHEHIDHIKGLGIISRKYDLPIYANENTWEKMEGKLGKLQGHNIKTFETEKEFSIADIRIKPFAISHDAVEPVAFSFMKNKFKLSVVTDLGYVDDKIKEEIRDADFLMIEANHDEGMLKIGEYPWYLKQRILGAQGHISNETTGKTLREIFDKKQKNKQILLAHLSSENNFPELAYQTIENLLAEKQIFIGQDLNVDLTFKNQISKVYKIK